MPDLRVSFNLSDLWFAIKKNGGPRSKIEDLKTAGQVLAAPWKIRERAGVYFVFGRPPQQILQGRLEAAPVKSIFMVKVDQGMTLFDCGWVSYEAQNSDDAEAFLNAFGEVPKHATAEPA